MDRYDVLGGVLGVLDGLPGVPDGVLDAHGGLPGVTDGVPYVICLAATS